MPQRSPSIYGLMAEFQDPNALVAATYRAHYEGYRTMDAYSPFPIEELHEALGESHTRLPLIVLLGGSAAASADTPFSTGPAGISHPAQYRRQALQQLADVHPGHLRVHHPRRRAVGRAGHAGAEWPAHALSSGVQRAALRAGQPQPLLSVHRGSRFEVRARERRAVFSKHSARSRYRPLRAKAMAIAHMATAALMALGSLCLPAGHARSAEVIRRSKPRPSLPTTARRGRRWRAPSRAASCGTIRRSVYRQGERRDVTGFPFPITGGDPRARTGALQHLLLAVPRPDRRRRRHRRPTRVHSAAAARCSGICARRRRAISST